MPRSAPAAPPSGLRPCHLTCLWARALPLPLSMPSVPFPRFPFLPAPTHLTAPFPTSPSSGVHPPHTHTHTRRCPPPTLPASGPPTYGPQVVASSLDELSPVLLGRFADKAELQAALAASANVPVVAGPPRTVRGQRLVDAAVFEPVPVASAIADGCTHCLVLCTRLPREQYADADTTATAAAAAAGGSGGGMMFFRRGTGAQRPKLRQLARRALDRLVKRTVLNPVYMKTAWRSARSDVTYIHDELLYAAHYQ
eukprot:364750-Chlamydomonas_euryale.AAC.20